MERLVGRLDLDLELNSLLRLLPGPFGLANGEHRYEISEPKPQRGFDVYEAHLTRIELAGPSLIGAAYSVEWSASDETILDVALSPVAFEVAEILIAVLKQRLSGREALELAKRYVSWQKVFINKAFRKGAMTERQIARAELRRRGNTMFPLRYVSVRAPAMRAPPQRPSTAVSGTREPEGETTALPANITPTLDRRQETPDEIWQRALEVAESHGATDKNDDLKVFNPKLFDEFTHRELARKFGVQLRVMEGWLKIVELYRRGDTVEMMARYAEKADRTIGRWMRSMEASGFLAEYSQRRSALDAREGSGPEPN